MLSLMRQNVQSWRERSPEVPRASPLQMFLASPCLAPLAALLSFAYVEQYTRDFGAITQHTELKTYQALLL
jgi:hypothetical protein